MEQGNFAYILLSRTGNPLKSDSIRIIHIIFVRESEQKNVNLSSNGVSVLSAHFEETRFTEGKT